MKVTAYMILGVITLLIVLILGIEWWLATRIRRMAEKELADRTGGALRFDVGRVRINLLSRSLILRDITVSTTSFAKDTTSVAFPVESLDATIDRLVARGIHFRQKGESRDRYFALSLLEIENLKGTLVLKDWPKDQPAEKRDVDMVTVLQSLSDRLTKRLGTLSVGRFRLSGSLLRVVVGNQGSYGTKRLTVAMDGFHAAPGESLHPYFCDDLRLDIGKVSLRFIASAQLLEMETVKIWLRSKELSFRNVRLIPQYGKAEYAWKVARHTDWTQVIAGSIEVTGVDFDLFWRAAVLQIDLIRIDNLDVASYKNRRIVRQERFKPMVHEMIQSVPFGLVLRRVEVAQAHAVYEELSASGAEPGRISFDQMNGVFREVTNRPGAESDYFTLVASGKVMDMARVRVVLRFPAHVSNDHFEVDGTVGPLDLRLLNGILEPLSEAAIRTGQLDGLAFKIVGTGRRARVDMKLRYRDLSIAILREDSTGHKHERRLMSGFVNLMLIKGANPDRKGMRVVQHMAVRDTTRSQFNYLWKTLLAGIKGSVGFPGAAATVVPDGGDELSSRRRESEATARQCLTLDSVSTDTQIETETDRPVGAHPQIEMEDGTLSIDADPNVGEVDEISDAK